MARRSQRFRYSSERGQTAVVVALQEPFQAAHEVAGSSLELARLAATLGLEVVRTVVQERQHASAARLLSDGKIRELREFTAPLAERPERAPALQPEEPIDLVLVDGSLTPAQQRQLERDLEIEVLDRTAIILRIFEWRARTREARLQVRLARLIYETPRIRDDRSLGDREGGGGRGGRGNSNVELKKQQNRRAIAELRRELEAATAAERGRRSRRDDMPNVALIGYTNAGKSSLMRALTGSEVLVEDKLFATLQLTVRALADVRGPRILVADTVGFIDDLPHELVASFRATLDEARDAQLLLIVADCSDRDFREQLYVTRTTLAQVGAGDVPFLLVLNKADKIARREREALAREFPEAVVMSAHDRGQVVALRERVVRHFSRELLEVTLEVPYERAALLAEMHAEGQVLELRHGPRGTRVRLRAPKSAARRFTQALAKRGRQRIVPVA